MRSHASRLLRATSALVAASLTIAALAGAPVAAADPPDLHGPAPASPRGGPKGTGTPPASQPTGRLIVRYHPGIDEPVKERIRANTGVRRIGTVALPNAELVEPRGDAASTMKVLASRSEVLSIEPEYRRTLAAGPTGEQYFGEQWGLHNTGQVIEMFAGAPDVDMNVPEAWAVTTGSADIVVAVIDDGVDLAHPDLADRAWVNPAEVAGNGIDDDANGLVDDVNGWDFCSNDATVHDAEDFHGTHVAGSIAASGNGGGIAGVAPTVRIMALKFINPHDPACGTDTQAIAAIAYARAHGAQIVNMSWGGPDYSAALAAAIGAADEALFVAAAGNDDIDIDLLPVYPAAYDLPNLLTVAAIHNEGSLSQFSNYGVERVDLSAPGEDILSSLPDGDHGYLDGTSMAAANASGVAALAASSHVALSTDGEALHDHLIATARALPTTAGWVDNARLLDARAAVVRTPDIRRLAGANRYATSAAISAATFPPYVPYLFVATGTNFPDALAGSALAAKVGAPLLLVTHTSIPAPVLAEIQRLRPFDIFVLGGTGAVSNTVLNQLAAYDNEESHGPFRVSGSDRFGTAVEVSELGFEPDDGWVFVANGMNFPDALAGGPAAASMSAPVLLTAATSLPQVTRAELGRLNPSRIVVLGGTSVVSQGVFNELKAYAQGGNVVRWAGGDRYATAAAIAGNAFPTAATAYVSSGENFPDALSGGAAAGAFGGPLVTTPASTLPQVVKDRLVALDPVRIFVLGGSGTVSATVVSELDALFP